MPVDPRILAAMNAPLRGGPSTRQLHGLRPTDHTCGSCRHRQPTGSDFREWACARGERSGPISHVARSCKKWEKRHG